MLWIMYIMLKVSLVVRKVVLIWYQYNNILSSRKNGKDLFCLLVGKGRHPRCLPLVVKVLRWPSKCFVLTLYICKAPFGMSELQYNDEMWYCDIMNAKFICEKRLYIYVMYIWCKVDQEIRDCTKDRVQ